MSIEKKPGLYYMDFLGRIVEIDVYGDEAEGWFYGRGSDCGNAMTDRDWEGIVYIGPTSDDHLAAVSGLTKSEYGD